MSDEGIAFGRRLRQPSWRRLPVRQRLALEAAAFTQLHPAAANDLSVFWYASHVPALALLARVDCPGTFNPCLNASDPTAFLPAVTALLWCSGLIIMRDTDNTFPRRSVTSVPLPPDFAGFEEDGEFLGHEPPPILTRGGGFSFTSSFTETPRGVAVVAMGLVPIHERLFTWRNRTARGLEESGRVFLGAFLPPTYVEAAFLDAGLYFHRSTALLPLFVDEPPWADGEPVRVRTIPIPYLAGCAPLDLARYAEARFAEIDARARTLAALIDRAERVHGGAAAEDVLWEDDANAWERAHRRFLTDILEDVATSGGAPPSIRVAALTVHTCGSIPEAGAWRQSIPELDQQVAAYAGSTRASMLRGTPVSYATIEV